MPLQSVGQLQDNPQVLSEREVESEVLRAQPTSTSRIFARAADYSLLHQEISQDQDEAQIVLTKFIPAQLLDKYRRAVMRKTTQRQLENGTWYAEIGVGGFEGVWANKETLKDCLDELDEVLLDWLFLKIEDEDRNIPIVDDIDLNVL